MNLPGPPSVASTPSLPEGVDASLSARVASTPASIEVAGRIREAILSGQIPLGAPITERWISDQYGVSRTTTRDVLQILVTERYLERHPYRSASVRTFNKKDMQDNLNARLLIETEAAKACPNADYDSVRQLQAALTRYCTALDAEDSVAAATAHCELHTAIAAMTGNTALARFESELMLDASLFLDVINVREADTKKMKSEHVRLTEAFLGGDAVLAERLVREHIRMVVTATSSLNK